MLSLNREELAWAAGFFDGEGSTVFVNARWKDRLYPTFRIQLPQCETTTLERFKRAVGGLGYISSKGKVKACQKPQFVYTVSRWQDAQAVAAMLFQFLSAPKQEQMLRAMRPVTEYKLRNAS